MNIHYFKNTNFKELRIAQVTGKDLRQRFFSSCVSHYPLLSITSRKFDLLQLIKQNNIYIK